MPSSGSSRSIHVPLLPSHGKALPKDKQTMARLKKVPEVVKKAEVRKIPGLVQHEKVRRTQKVVKDEETEVYVVDLAKTTGTAVQLPFDKEVICNPEILFKTISRSICNWRMLGRYLLIPDDEIDKIATETMETEQEKALKMFMTWRYRMLMSSQEITYRILTKALHSSLNNKVIQKLKEHHYGNSSTEAGPSQVDHHSAARVSTEELKIEVPLMEFWENIKPFIENKLSRGYTHVTVALKFQK